MAQPPFTIRYSRRQKRFFLLYGLLMLAWGVLGLVPDFYPRAIDIGFVALGMVFLGAFHWHRRTPYLRVEKDALVQPGWKTKRIPLEDLHTVRTFAGDLILESRQAKITLNKEGADKEDLEELLAFLAPYSSQPV